MGRGDTRARGKKERIAVPAMPCPMATLCCVLNFLVPGLGTILAGFSVFCCSRNEDLNVCERLGSFCASFWIGLLQLILTPLLLLGWIWSCIWGVSFIGMSNEYYHDNPVTDDNSAQNTNVISQQPIGHHWPDYGQQQPHPVMQPRPSPSAPPPDMPYPATPDPVPFIPNPGGYGEPPPPYSPPGTYPESMPPPKK